MARNSDDDRQSVDRATSGMVANAIGDRLQRDYGPSYDLPAPLQDLIDEMRRREAQGR